MNIMLSHIGFILKNENTNDFLWGLSFGEFVGYIFIPFVGIIILIYNIIQSNKKKRYQEIKERVCKYYELLDIMDNSSDNLNQYFVIDSFERLPKNIKDFVVKLKRLDTKISNVLEEYNNRNKNDKIDNRKIYSGNIFVLIKNKIKALEEELEKYNAHKSKE